MKNSLHPLTPIESFGRWVKDARTTYRMSQAELAKRAGTTQSEISRLESGRGNPTLKSMQELAGVFNMDIKLRFGRRD